jgi:hypothetical protein
MAAMKDILVWICILTYSTTRVIYPINDMILYACDVVMLIATIMFLVYRVLQK